MQRHQQSEALATAKLVSVGTLAKHLSLSKIAIYQLIRRRQLGPESGVYRVLDGRTVRIDEAAFIGARATPPSTDGDRQLQGQAGTVLADLLTIRTQIDHLVERVTGTYDNSAARLDAATVKPRRRGRPVTPPTPTVLIRNKNAPEAPNS
jgi:hypothetical protein